MDKIAGTCPACGGYGTLFAGQGGYITCSRADCPDPGAVADLLDRPTYHVLELGEDGWSLQHAITCFPDLLDCETHQRVSRWLSSSFRPPANPGRYRLAELNAESIGGPFRLIAAG